MDRHRTASRVSHSPHLTDLESEMSPCRLLTSLVRPVTLALLFLMAASVTQAAWYMKFDGVEGEVAIEGFELDILGSEPSAALLLPAIQKVRDAAARMNFAQLACDGTVMPRMIVEVTDGNSARPYMSIELTDVLISGYGMQAD